jgi:hypothetical protein
MLGRDCCNNESQPTTCSAYSLRQLHISLTGEEFVEQVKIGAGENLSSCGKSEVARHQHTQLDVAIHVPTKGSITINHSMETSASLTLSMYLCMYDWMRWDGMGCMHVCMYDWIYDWTASDGKHVCVYVCVYSPSKPLKHTHTHTHTHTQLPAVCYAFTVRPLAILDCWGWSCIRAGHPGAA